MYQLFAERNTQLLRQSGAVGLVLPSSFHANAGATGIRRLFLYNMTLVNFQNKDERKSSPYPRNFMQRENDGDKPAAD
jgi:hypothetical protein